MTRRRFSSGLFSAVLASSITLAACTGQVLEEEAAIGAAPLEAATFIPWASTLDRTPPISTDTSACDAQVDPTRSGTGIFSTIRAALDHARTNSLLGAGYVLCIFHNAAAYNEKFLINVGGSSTNPLIVRGIPDADGNLPQINGDGATDDDWDVHDDSYQGGVLRVIGTSSTAADHVVVENLKIFGARRGGLFYRIVNGSNVSDQYWAYEEVNKLQPALIKLKHANNVIIRNCELTDGSLAVNSHDTTSFVLLEGNRYYGPFEGR